MGRLQGAGIPILENADPSISGLNENLKFPSPSRTSCSVLQCLPLLPGESSCGQGRGCQAPLTVLPSVPVKQVEFQGFSETLARQSLHFHSEGKKSKQHKDPCSNQAFIRQHCKPIGDISQAVDFLQPARSHTKGTKGDVSAHLWSRGDLVLSTSEGPLPA